MASVTRLKNSTNRRPEKKIKMKIKNKKGKKTGETSNSQYQYAESYVKLRKSLKSTHLIVRLHTVSEEKSAVLLGKQFQILTTRSV